MRHKSTPFGVRGHNNLTFADSATDPASNLSRMVRYLEARQGRGLTTTKRDILRDVFNRPNAGRGWASGFFTLAAKAGFITRRRVGRGSVYGVGRTPISA